MDQSSLKQVGQLTNSLFSESTFKGLLAGFAQSLKSFCHCTSFGALIIDAQSVKRLSLKLDGLSPLPATVIEGIQKILDAKENHSEDFLNGWVHIDLSGTQYIFCAVPYQGP